MKQVYILSIIIWILVGIIPTNSMLASTNIDANIMSVQVPLQNNTYRKSLNYSYKVQEIGFKCGVNDINQNNLMNNSFRITTLSSTTRSKNKRYHIWFSDNFLQTDRLMRSGSVYASAMHNLNENTTIPSPRRVSGNEHDPDPFMGEPVPIGDTPIYLLIILTIMYAYRKRLAVK